MRRTEGKATRINQIEKLLWSHPEGLTRMEVARRVGVHRSDISKYLDQDRVPRTREWRHARRKGAGMSAAPFSFTAKIGEGLK